MATDSLLIMCILCTIMATGWTLFMCILCMIMAAGKLLITRRDRLYHSNTDVGMKA